MQNAGLSRRLVIWLGLVLLIAYSLWIGGPYLRSIVTRDAAVTTWISDITTPIDGVITHAAGIGETAGADGRVFTIENPRADSGAVARAQADLDRARERLASVTRIVSEVEALTIERAARAQRYADLFKRNLDTKIGGMTTYVAITEQNLKLERNEANRRSQLLTDGVEAPTGAEAAAMRAAGLEREIVDWQTGLDRAKLHRRAADAGLFFLDDGSDGGADQRALEEARLALDRARSDLAVARRDVEAAQQVLERSQRLFDETQRANVLVPPGATVWSESASRGTVVSTGTTMGTWIDCRIMLVDAPVSDIELSLLRPGAAAEVVLEGERSARHGTILLMRGAASILGRTDLAAVAKGRLTGEGQVLVTLTPTPEDVARCPIGRAAFVHCPDVSVRDIALARLRLF